MPRQFEISTQRSDGPLTDYRLVCRNDQGNEAGYVVYTLMDGEFCIHIQGIFVQPEFRQQGIGSALLRHMQETYPDTPLYVHFHPVSNGIGLAALSQFFSSNGFEIKQFLAYAAEGYYGFS